MDTFNRIVLGIAAIAIGVAVLKYNFKLVNFTGSVGVAEKIFGAGGTYSFFKMIAIVVILGGILYMTGLADPLLRWLLQPLAGYFGQQQ